MKIFGIKVQVQAQVQAQIDEDFIEQNEHPRAKPILAIMLLPFGF